jgi:uncharacterized protein YndB with AHSA1/START domain
VYIQTMASQTEYTIVIRRPLEEVFAYATNADHITEWQPWIEKAWHNPEGPTAVGTTVHVVNRFLGRSSEAQSVVTEYQPNAAMVAEGSGGPFRFRTTYRFEPVGNGTHLRCVIENQARGAAKLVLPVVTWAVGRQMAKSFESLQRVLESGQVVP